MSIQLGSFRIITPALIIANLWGLALIFRFRPMSPPTPSRHLENTCRRHKQDICLNTILYVLKHITWNRSSVLFQWPYALNNICKRWRFSKSWSFHKVYHSLVTEKSAVGIANQPTFIQSRSNIDHVVGERLAESIIGSVCFPFFATVLSSFLHNLAHWKTFFNIIYFQLNTLMTTTAFTIVH